MKLTKSKVDAFKCPEGKAQAFLWCSEARGFGLRMTAAGVKSFVVQGRVNGQERRMTIGRYGVFTVEQAREEAIRVLQGMRLGTDPVEEQRRREIEGITLSQVKDAYLRDRDLKASSRADIERHVTKSFKDWANKPVAKITRAACMKHFRELSDNGLNDDDPGPAPAQARQAFRILRALLNYARAAYRSDDKPTLPENPVDVLSEAKLWGRTKARTGRIPNEKIGEVWSLLRTRRKEVRTVDDHTSADYVAFLMLTGARASEAAQLTWDRVALGDDAGSWHLPDPKNGRAVTFPLCTAAREILAARRELPPASEKVMKRRSVDRPEREGSPYVFPSWGKSGHINDARGTMQAVSEVAGVHISRHDLRRTFRAVADKAGVSFEKTKLLMNHVASDVTLKHYTDTTNLHESCAAEAEAIGRWITSQGAVADAVAANPKVVALRA